MGERVGLQNPFSHPRLLPNSPQSGRTYPTRCVFWNFGSVVFWRCMGISVANRHKTIQSLKSFLGWTQNFKIIFTSDWLVFFSRYTNAISERTLPKSRRTGGRISAANDALMGQGWWWPLSYCWWKKSCTTWDVYNLVNNKINYQPQLVIAGFLNHQQ